MPCPPDASSTRYTAAVWTRGRTPRIAVTDATTPTRECLCVVRVNNAQVLPNWACVVRTMPGSRRCVWSVRRPEEMEKEGLSGVPPGVHGKQELAFVPLKKSHSTEPSPVCAPTHPQATVNYTTMHVGRNPAGYCAAPYVPMPTAGCGQRRQATTHMRGMGVVSHPVTGRGSGTAPCKGPQSHMVATRPVVYRTDWGCEYQQKVSQMPQLVYIHTHTSIVCRRKSHDESGRPDGNSKVTWIRICSFVRIDWAPRFVPSDWCQRRGKKGGNNTRRVDYATCGTARSLMSLSTGWISATQRAGLRSICVPGVEFILSKMPT